MKKIMLSVFGLFFIGNLFFLNASGTLSLDKVVFTNPEKNNGQGWEFKPKEYNMFMEYHSIIKTKLAREGYKSDEESISNYLSRLPSLWKHLCQAAVDKILDCDSFPSSHKDTFKKNLDQRKLDLSFNFGLGGTNSRDMLGKISMTSAYLDSQIIVYCRKTQIRRQFGN